MVVQHNLTAMNSNRMLGLTTSSQAKSTEKLSSGYKINRAADDAAGLAISEKMRKQVRGLTQASANAQDGISAVQTAEGALTEVHDMLQRMNELAVKAANGTMSEDDRSYVQNEIDQLVTEIDRVAETTKFNETYLLKGSGDKSATIKGEATVGAAGSATTSDAIIKEATGNQFSGTIATGLGSGTEETATITYKDADGNTRTQDVTFKVGSDPKTTAANLAKAITDDAKLGKIFNASTDEDGKLTIESKLNGNKTDGTKNAVTNLTFTTPVSSADAKTTITKADGITAGGDIKEATGESILLKISDSTGANALTAGNSITIDGKTYTYDPDKAATSPANTFASVDDLQKLLGSDYDVTVSLNQTVSNQKIVMDGAVSTKTEGASWTTSEEGALKATKTSSAIGGLGASDFDGLSSDNSDNIKVMSSGATDGTNTGTQKKPTVDGIFLNIARKATNEISDTMNLSLHVGADSTQENKISIDIESMNAKGLGIDGLKVDGENSKNADNAIDTIEAAIKKVSTQRSSLGAIQNRLEHTINNLDNVVENTTSAESAIRDTDMATEMVRFANNNILAQAGQSMLAQANQSNQGVLSLLG